MNYDCLFQPIKIGSLEIKNRFVMPAMDSGTTTLDHRFSRQSCCYFGARAAGGFGLIIPEYMAVSPYGIGNCKEAALWDDSYIEGLKELTQEVHKNGAKIFAQLHHSGMMCVEKNTGVQPAGPSAIAATNYLEKVREYSNQEVYELIEDYAKGALRAKMSGFDGVEIHAAHHYLLAQFLSDFTNKRVDEFGGSFTNRFRIIAHIIKRIRELCGEDFPQIMRISAEEFLEGGNHPEDAFIYCRMAQQAGIDAIHLSTGTGMGGNIVAPYYYQPGFNVEFSERLKKMVQVPVITVGRINDPAMAEQIVASGRADMVSLGRQSVCDPEFPNKVKEGRIDEIFQCTGCMQRCYYSKGCEDSDVGISCMMNPFSGKEDRWKILPAQKKKKIAVIGAGPGGLEAAWVLAKRGHEVDVYEKNSTAGGTFRLAMVPPFKQDFGKMIFTFETLLKKYGGRIHYNTELSNEMLGQLDVDELILATGCQPLVPPIPGLDLNKVKLANQVLLGEEIISGKKVLVIGGGLVGCETAEFLNLYHNEITIIDMMPKLAKDCVSRVRSVLLERLENAGTDMLTQVKVTEILPDGVRAERLGEEIVLEGYDEMVLALGARSYNPLEEEAKKYFSKVHVIGDAFRARDAKYAIYEGAKLAMEL